MFLFQKCEKFQVCSRMSVNVAAVRIYLFEHTGIFSQPLERIFKSARFFAKISELRELRIQSMNTTFIKINNYKKMKTFVTFILLSVCVVIINAQENITINRENLILLYANAQKAERLGDYQQAINIYKSMLFIDQKQATPYLKMANIYSANPSDEDTTSLAITFYQKFLELEPNGRNSSVVRSRVEYLKSMMAEKGWQQQHYDISEIIQSGQQQTRDIIVAAVHPALKANSREEIEQQVDDVYTTFDKGETAYQNNNSQVSEQYLNKVIETADPTSPVFLQTNMLLAQKYGEEGNIQKMQEILTSVEESFAINKQYLNYKIKDAVPFGDDICGVWVSSLSTDKNAVPYLAFEIVKTGQNNYECEILPYSTLAQEYSMYKGRGYKYTPKSFDNQGTIQEYPYSVATDFKPENNQIVFKFGNEKFRKGLNKDMAVAAMDVVDQTAKDATDIVVHNPSISSNEADMIYVVVQIAAFIIKIPIMLFTISSKTNVILDANMQSVFPGCVDLELTEITVKEKSSGYEKESINTSNFRMFKLYPEYGVNFTSSSNELFGSAWYTKTEAQGKEEYSEVMALKDKGYFNRKNYKKLSEKVSQYCFAKAKEDPNMKIMAYTTLDHFEYGNRGLTKKQLTDKDGNFSGWVNMKGQKNGFGVFELNSGYKYTGNFKDDKFLGEGKLTFPNGAVYTGYFTNNKCNGKGILDYYYNIEENGYKYEGDFVNDKFAGQGIMTTTKGKFFEGIWKDGVFIKGKSQFEDGIFDGNWTKIKVENQDTYVPNGEGTLVKSNGETIIGKWKNGVCITEKQK